jgi:hypothetical protein
VRFGRDIEAGAILVIQQAVVATCCTPEPAVVVPNTPEINGNVFYLVHAIKQDGAIIYASTPIKVTLRTE